MSVLTSVTICSSSKFYDTAREAEAALRALGMTVYTPRYDYNEQFVTVDEPDKARLTHEFLAKIDRSDAVFVIANDGYAGASVCIEVGYAAGQGKTILFSEQPAELALRALVDAVVPVDAITDGVRSIGHADVAARRSP
ncbi:nucleoside 2-deoxyribosyltransferase [Micromonospora echinospora]|uniref:Nucleoside 2-deoxyribosyltransferase n=1 Tax=Micromonospora echinospora TaxID=1877 RepID=A0ABR6MGE8_MICEC|nr:nucleoside 2-deoxyribosyltransferase [Micromonospora echinospora]MBB5114461.1 nucleoside 2-deoxyribosyltransferase [Micromonospora echinospora]